MDALVTPSIRSITACAQNFLYHRNQCFGRSMRQFFSESNWISTKSDRACGAPRTNADQIRRGCASGVAMATPDAHPCNGARHRGARQPGHGQPGPDRCDPPWRSDARRADGHRPARPSRRVRDFRVPHPSWPRWGRPAFKGMPRRLRHVMPPEQRPFRWIAVRVRGVWVCCRRHGARSGEGWRLAMRCHRRQVHDLKGFTTSNTREAGLPRARQPRSWPRPGTARHDDLLPGVARAAD